MKKKKKLTEKVNIVSPGAPKTVPTIAITCLAVHVVSQMSPWTRKTLSAILDSKGQVALTGGDCRALWDGVRSAESLSTVRNGSLGLVHEAANVTVLC